MRNGLIALVSALVGLQFWLTDAASAHEGSVFERVGKAYQVDRLIAAKTIRLEEEHRSESANHDYGPDFHETSYQRRHYVLDLRNLRGSQETVADIASTFFHSRRIINDGREVAIFYGPGVYQDDGVSGFYGRFGAVIRAFDPLLAIWLVRSEQNARIEDDEVWLGREHDKVTIDFPESPPLTILVDKATGLISKMQRVVGGRTKVSYVFDRHKFQSGIPIATESYIYGGRDKLVYAFDQRIVLDDPADQAAFEIDPGIVLQPKRIDQSVETTEQISDNVHHIGQGAAYSTFVRVGDEVVAFGLSSGFAGRLETYRAATGDMSPLSFGVVPDHHQIELGGVTEAVLEGASLLITRDADERARAATRDLERANIEIIDAPKSIGTLTIIPLSTSHASRVLVGYESEARILTQQGHWIKWFETAPVWATISDVTLLQALEPHKLPIDLILSTEGRGAGDWETFLAQAAKFAPVPCHRNRPICADWR